LIYSKKLFELHAARLFKPEERAPYYEILIVAIKKIDEIYKERVKEVDTVLARHEEKWLKLIFGYPISTSLVGCFIVVLGWIYRKEKRYLENLFVAERKMV
jgi:hypothetical protein